MGERVYLWDNIKVILMVLVILTHSVCIYQIGGGKWIEYYWVFVMTYTMPLFTLASGYWFKQKAFGKVLYRFLWPCIIFSIVNFAWGSLFYEPYKEATLNTYLRFGYAMWYLWALFIYYLLTPLLLRYLRLSTLFVLSLAFALIAGVIPFIGGALQLSRVICFYPFFIMGMLLREHSDQMKPIGRKYQWAIVLLTLSILYIVIDFFFPGVVYQTGFVSGYGLSIRGFVWRVFTYFMCMAMCLAVIYAMPEKKLWFSKYGTRTMNVYLLHMLIVFPCTWYVGSAIKDEWYGYVFLIIGVPLLCMPLFSKKVDCLMKKVLLIS